MGTYLYGRTMYEMMTGWENDPTMAGQSPKSAEFAQIWQAAEKVVFSRSLESASTKRTRIERTFDPDLVRDLKASAAEDLNVSGATLAASAWNAGLIDECHLFIAPMLVGGGKRMFPDDIRQPLELLDQRRFGNGMVSSATPWGRESAGRERPSQDGDLALGMVLSLLTVALVGLTYAESTRPSPTLRRCSTAEMLCCRPCGRACSSTCPSTHSTTTPEPG